MEPIAGALASLVAAKDLVVTAVKARDIALIESATAEMNRKFIDIQNVALDLQQRYLTAMSHAGAVEDRARSLEREMEELRYKVTERERYELYEPRTGTFIYRVKPGTANGEPMHYLCQQCMDSGKKIVLQLRGPNLVCVSCERAYQVADVPKKPPRQTGTASAYLRSRGRG